MRSKTNDDNVGYVRDPKETTTIKKCLKFDKTIIFRNIQQPNVNQSKLKGSGNKKKITKETLDIVAVQLLFTGTVT